MPTTDEVAFLRPCKLTTAFAAVGGMTFLAIAAVDKSYLGHPFIAVLSGLGLLVVGASFVGFRHRWAEYHRQRSWTRWYTTPQSLNYHLAVTTVAGYGAIAIGLLWLCVAVWAAFNPGGSF